MTTFADIHRIHKPKPRYNVIKEIAERWSPRHFSNEEVSRTHLNIIFEAARWAPSGHNQQPWHYFYVKKNTTSYKKLFSTLIEYNQSWARTAPVLILACTITRGAKEENPFAFYDLGASVFSLILQARSLGYYTRQIGLFDKERVKKDFKLEKNLQPYVIIALGKIGDYKNASKEVIGYELDPRPRKTNISTQL